MSWTEILALSLLVSDVTTHHRSGPAAGDPLDYQCLTYHYVVVGVRLESLGTTVQSSAVGPRVYGWMSVGVPAQSDVLCLWLVLVTETVMFTLYDGVQNHLLDPPPPAILDCPTDLGTVCSTDAVTDSDRQTSSEPSCE